VYDQQTALYSDVQSCVQDMQNLCSNQGSVAEILTCLYENEGVSQSCQNLMNILSQTSEMFREAQQGAEGSESAVGSDDQGFPGEAFGPNENSFGGSDESFNGMPGFPSDGQGFGPNEDSFGGNGQGFGGFGQHGGHHGGRMGSMHGHRRGPRGPMWGPQDGSMSEPMQGGSEERSMEGSFNGVGHLSRQNAFRAPRRSGSTHPPQEGSFGASDMGSWSNSYDNWGSDDSDMEEMQHSLSGMIVFGIVHGLLFAAVLFGIVFCAKRVCCRRRCANCKCNHECNRQAADVVQPHRDNVGIQAVEVRQDDVEQPLLFSTDAAEDHGAYRYGQ